ncbi:MAG: DUF2617 family protein [Planctomycetota bacterium]
MSVRVARPDVSDLLLCAYERPLHPEMFVHHRAITLQNARMSLDARLCAAGHVMILRVGSETLTEVISDRHEPLPRRSRLFEHRLRGCHTETIELDFGVRYSVGCSVERLSPAAFLRHHQEFVGDCPQASLSAMFASSNRFTPGPVSLLRTEVTRESMLVHAFHTFPDHLAVVKTQSLFELV